MRLGATLVHLADAPPYDVVAWATRLHAAGFDSLWAPEIIGRGPLVPDPFVALAAAAPVSGSVELVTATIQAPLHHPAELAHRVRSLQAVCGARLSLGISPGSTKTDYDLLGADFAGRFETFHRHAGRLRAMLGSDAPPILLGSWGRNVERAAREFDGWLASGVRTTPDEILAAHDRYRAAGGKRAVAYAVPVDSDADLEPTAAALRRYAAAGFDDAVIVFGPDAPPPEDARSLLLG